MIKNQEFCVYALNTLTIDQVYYKLLERLIMLDCKSTSKILEKQIRFGILNDIDDVTGNQYFIGSCWINTADNSDVVLFKIHVRLCELSNRFNPIHEKLELLCGHYGFPNENEITYGPMPLDIAPEQCYRQRDEATYECKLFEEKDRSR